MPTRRGLLVGGDYRPFVANRPSVHRRTQGKLLRVVINGENWGVYANQQQFNKEFLKDNFDTKKGTSWKVPQGGGNGIGGFRYVGDDVESYRGEFQIKSKDQAEAWKALIGLVRTFDTTADDELEAALSPVLDLDRSQLF